MILEAGAKYRIPFPVFARASFGVKGANIPAMLRAIVACGWFGIQTWIGGFALYQMLRLWIPSLAALPFYSSPYPGVRRDRLSQAFLLFGSWICKYIFLVRIHP